MTDAELDGHEDKRASTADEIAEIRRLQNPEIWNLTEREAQRAELMMRMRALRIRIDEVHMNSLRILTDAIDWLSKERL